jgi:hypothetical protein
MDKVIAFVTAVHVLMHSTFGCCSHAIFASFGAAEPHTCGHATSAGVPRNHHHHGNAPSVEAHDNCERMTTLGNQEVPSDPLSDHECRHDSCSWVVSTGPSMPSLAELLSTPAIVPVLTVATSFDSRADLFVGDEGTLSLAPPLRLHLALGVLLI